MSTEKITYEGKQYPIKVGYYALKHASRELQKEGGKELEMETLLSGQLENYEPILYHAMVMGARLEKKELDLKREDMEFVLDECLWQFIEILPKFFPSKVQEKLGNQTGSTQ